MNNTIRIATLLVAAIILLISCKEEEKTEISEVMVGGHDSSHIVDSLLKVYPDHEFRIRRGVSKVASLWKAKDGNRAEMEQFIYSNFQVGEDLDSLLIELDRSLEIINGNFNKMSVSLKMPVHTNSGEIGRLESMLADWEPSAHFQRDMFDSKTAYLIALNFPEYTFEEKRKLGPEWTDREWAEAKAGDLFSRPINPKANQAVSQAQSEADKYISEYYIYMGNVVDSTSKSPFPEEMRLISHWNLRDEIKANYANNEKGYDKQNLIYNVMLRIIGQDIPQQVINSDEYLWNPISNNLYGSSGDIVEVTEEDTMRYHHLLVNFQAVREADEYYPEDKNYIYRKFNGEMGYDFHKIEDLFTQLVSSEQVKKTAELIEKRLGRELEPWDIWYDGFKARSLINEEKLSEITRKRYPDAQAFKNDLPRILRGLGFGSEDSRWLAEQVEVDASRGAGHAWGAQMKSDHARLRTHIKEDGMDYKGYNIAVHEFGHNIEQTISLHSTPYYIMSGVPNTAFSEATAFVFQSRDLDLLGMEGLGQKREHYAALDNLWTNYEMMGVSLVDMRVWKWLYENPDTDVRQLKKQVIKIAKEVWNEYYAPLFEQEDSPILAVYSHMIDYPLYLASYPVGYLAQFQLEEYMRGKSLAEEMERILAIGNIPPDIWMEKAVGKALSPEPLFRAADRALEALKDE